MNQTAPRPMGNYFEFTPQTAPNTLLTSRLPAGWTTPPNRVFIMGFGWPFTISAADGFRRFTNYGFTHAERPEFVAKLGLPVSKRFLMGRDADAKGQAQTWAAELPDSDVRKTHIAAYGANRAVTSTDYSIYRELGRRTWNAIKGGGLDIVGLDIETFADNTPVSTQQQFTVAINLGLTDGIAQDNAATRIFQYGGSLASFSIYAQSREDDKWMRTPGDTWVGANSQFDVNASALATKYRTEGAYVGRDQYFRHTFDDTHSFYQKNNDGSIKTDGNGKPLWYLASYPNTTVTNYGKSAVITTNEAQLTAEMCYEEADNILQNLRWWCNTPIDYAGHVGDPMPYPRGTWDLRAGLESLKLNGWFRDDTESALDSAANQEPPNSNRRPLYDRFVRFAVGMRTLFYHGNIMWSDKAWMNYTQGQPFSKEQGGSQVAQDDLAMGQYESMAAGHFQVSNFTKFFQLYDAGQLDFIWPVRFVNRGNDAQSEWESNKPIVSLQKEHNGRRVFAQWIWPTQDVGNASHERDITVWIVLANGTTSGSYGLHCKNRQWCMDGWTLPTGFEGALPEHFRFQWAGLTGTVFTRSGNYNVAVSGNPTPPAPITRQVLTN